MLLMFVLEGSWTQTDPKKFASLTCSVKFLLIGCQSFHLTGEHRVYSSPLHRSTSKLNRRKSDSYPPCRGEGAYH